MHFVMILSVLLLSLAISSPSNSKSLYIWKDEKGEIHITDQRPPAPIEVTYMSPPCDGSSEKDVAEYRKYQAEMTDLMFQYYESQEACNSAMRTIHRRAFEREQQAKKIKVAKAKRRYEWYKAREPEWKDLYNGSRGESERLYWKRKLEEVEEARKAYDDIELNH